MPGATGVIDGFGRLRAVFDQRRQRQAHQNKAANRHRGKKLAFRLFDALIEKTLEHVTEKLVMAVIAG